MQRLSEIVETGVVKALESQVILSERRDMDWEIVPVAVVIPGMTEPVLSEIVFLFYPVPGSLTDRICKQATILDPYASQPTYDRVIMGIVEEIRAEYDALKARQ